MHYERMEIHNIQCELWKEQTRIDLLIEVAQCVDH
jgi:hypothetical protein